MPHRAAAARDAEDVPVAGSPPALDVRGLTKRFGRVVAVDGLELTVPPGQVFGFLGPNGAGKSTTIRMLLGLARPTSGAARIFGIEVADVREAHRHLAYVPADVALWPSLTGAETLELLARVGPGTDLRYRSELVERFALEVDKPSRAYSTGNRQKVALIAAFATRAPLLVLDEPTSGLDPLMEQEFRRCVTEAAARGQTVFLSSHQLAEVEAVCTRVAILRAGRLVEVAGLADLRRLRRTEVDVVLAGPDRSALAGLQHVPGVSEVRWTGTDRLQLSLTGPPAAALRALAAAEVARIDVREPSLEEIFLSYYGGPAR
jgi:ABC-2 type transport system ATP-binding protein